MYRFTFTTYVVSDFSNSIGRPLNNHNHFIVFSVQGHFNSKMGFNDLTSALAKKKKNADKNFVEITCIC